MNLCKYNLVYKSVYQWFIDMFKNLHVWVDVYTLFSISMCFNVYKLLQRI